jgi:hypothetical protein
VDEELLLLLLELPVLEVVELEAAPPLVDVVPVDPLLPLLPLFDDALVAWDVVPPLVAALLSSGTRGVDEHARAVLRTAQVMMETGRKRIDRSAGPLSAPVGLPLP